MAEALIIRSWTPKDVIVKHGIGMLKYAATLHPERYPIDAANICEEAIKAVDIANIEKRKAKIASKRNFRTAHNRSKYRGHK